MKTSAFLAILAALSAWLGTSAGAVLQPPTASPEQVQALRVFPTPIEWSGQAPPGAAETQNLLGACTAFDSSPQAGIEELEALLKLNPTSGWAPSLHVQLAEHYSGRGRLSRALAHWALGWEATKRALDPRSQLIAVRSAAGWTTALAGIGRADELAVLLNELEELNLPLRSYGTPIMAARARLQRMRSQPQNSNGCGLLALNGLAESLRLDVWLRRQLLQLPAPEGGFSVAHLLSLARSNGVPLQAVRRPATARIPVPSVVHWGLNHFAVILEERSGSYRVIDPALGGELWMDQNAVLEEQSGVYIIQANSLPDYPRLNEADAAAIKGKGWGNSVMDTEDSPPEDCAASDDQDANCDPPSSNDGGDGGGPPNPPPPCCGNDSEDSDGDTPNGFLDPRIGHGSSPMPDGPFNYLIGGASRGTAVWRVSEPYISLWLHDTPLFYRLSTGKWMQLKLSYKQRGEDRGSSVGGFGPKWECNWLGLMYAKSGQSYFTSLTSLLRNRKSLIAKPAAGIHLLQSLWCPSRRL